MVSEVLDDPELLQINSRTIQFLLDLLDLTFAELFYGFTIISRIIVGSLKEHFETWTPVTYQIYQVNSKYFNGNSNNFHSLNSSPVFPQQGGKYMNSRRNWTIC